MNMRIFFAISASLWAFVVARCIAFGPNKKSLQWKPIMHSQTWYRLTPIKCGLIPYKWVSNMPLCIAAANIFTLFVDNTFIHSIATLKLLSEHLIISIFVAQKHNGIALWACCNAILSGGLFFFIPIEAQVGQIISFTIQIWIIYIQFYLTCVQNIVRELPEPESRLPRMV